MNEYTETSWPFQEPANGLISAHRQQQDVLMPFHLSKITKAKGNNGNSLNKRAKTDRQTKSSHHHHYLMIIIWYC